MSTQEIASSSLGAENADRCTRCGATLAGDQRYCLECGEPRAPARSALLGGSQPAASGSPGAPAPSSPPGYPQAREPARSNAVVVLAGVGVLLLAMGVGVLIGRSAASSSSTGPPEVITVGSTQGGGSTGTAGGEFTDNWPAGKSGYTVLLQSLPQATTTTSAVEQAKSAASAKGASAVGALRTGDFPSLAAGSYDVYSGEYTTKKQAEAALAKLKKSFPSASVIRVSAGVGAASGAGGGSGGSGSGASGSGGGAGSSGSSGSSSQLQKLSKTKGKSYEQESKNLPNEVGT